MGCGVHSPLNRSFGEVSVNRLGDIVIHAYSQKLLSISFICSGRESDNRGIHAEYTITLAYVRGCGKSVERSFCRDRNRPHAPSRREVPLPVCLEQLTPDNTPDTTPQSAQSRSQSEWMDESPRLA